MTVPTFGESAALGRREPVKKDRQRNYAGLAGLGAGTTLAGVGTAAYARHRVNNAHNADTRARQYLQRDYEAAQSAQKTAARKQGDALRRYKAGVKNWDNLNSFIHHDGGTVQTFPAIEGGRRTVRYNRNMPGHIKMAEEHALHVAGENKKLQFEQHEAWVRNNEAREAMNRAKQAREGFQPQAGKVVPKFTRWGRAGKIGAGLGAAATIGGMIGVERSRSYGPKKQQPRFSPASAVGQREQKRKEIEEAAKRGAAYRAMTGGTISREQVDSWYQKAPGER